MIAVLPVAMSNALAFAPMAAAAGAATAPDFARTLVDFLDARDAAATPAPAIGDERQKPADDGKDMPPAPVVDAAPADPSIAWAVAIPTTPVPMALPVPVPVPTGSPTRDAVPIAARPAPAAAILANFVSTPCDPAAPVNPDLPPPRDVAGSPVIAAPAPIVPTPPVPIPLLAEVPAPPAIAPALAASSVATPVSRPAPADAIPVPIAAATATAAPRAASAPIAPVAPAIAPAAFTVAQIVQTGLPLVAQPALQPTAPPIGPPKSDAPVAVDAQRRTDTAEQPAVAPKTPAQPALTINSVPLPARQVFAAAIAAAAGWHDRPARTDPAPAATPATITALDPPDRAVTAASAAPDTPLDLARDAGLDGMIDRIETLRDQADAADTRIRLVPDALGKVDIAVRQDGDAVRVHFTAERETTQALLLDAQPRLTDLAAARGLRIAETSVSTGSSPQQGQGANPQPQPQPRAAPFRRPADTTPDESTDQRLA